MGEVYASCGHQINQIPGDDYEAAIKEYSREGHPVVSFGVFCKKCYDWYKKEGVVLETKKEQDAWLGLPLVKKEKGVGVLIEPVTEIALKERTTMELWEQAWSLAGKSLFYMQFIRMEVDWGYQMTQVEKMCYHLAVEHRSHYDDTFENRCWFVDWIVKFKDETDNQC